ncbi:AAA family ATPase [Clostridium pasteurianum]|uniref:AAA family ATPase n=1 Tax=Clostridium pasteurianum TaxID=1501 RepID=UPI0008DBAFC5|nr:SbcC/MukB-like Walker B domain-containing protein [Clostridium pasteurianum]AOZ80046.1 nuclease SbcCD subunit C [Clostridium pasteurianum]
MRPIKLKIKGLNSFIDSQDIDFQKLTDKGLFGIFGPTGSGKSTILDGITLALYGEVARKSSNYMNTNCSSLNVSFEFQISSVEIKRYRVDREFRRDPKTGNVRTRSAKIISIENNEKIILEEGAKSVTGKCEEIIGLTLEDFTRTVVLPQGKFSEFLKLEGKDRRNMLERLFNLQKYGDNLSIKLNGKIKREREKVNLLDGELKGYENVNNEILQDKTNTLIEKKEHYDRAQEELKICEKKYDEEKELWNLQEELKEQLHRKAELKEREEDINKDSKKISLAESALKLKPYVDSYEDTLKQIANINNNLIQLGNKMKVTEENKKKAEAQLEKAKRRKEKDLPDLTIRQQKVIDAIEEKRLLDVLNREKIILEENINDVEKRGKSTNIKIEKNRVIIDNINSSIMERENKVETLIVHEEHKRKIDEGILILNTLQNLSKQKEDLSASKKSVLLSLEKAKLKGKNLLKKIKDNKDLLNNSNEDLNNLLQNCPGDENTLLNLQSQLNTATEKWNKYKEYNTKLNNGTKNIEVFKKDLDKRESERVFLEEEIKKIKTSIKKTETENIAHNLRNTLLEGKPCPVCGSKHHSIENIKILEINNVDELNLDLDNRDKKYTLLMQEIIKLQTNIKAEDKNIEECNLKIRELGDGFKSISVDELKTKFDILKQHISKFNEKKVSLDKKIKSLIEEKGILEVEYSRESTKEIENGQQLKKIDNNLVSLEDELNKNNRQLELLKKDTSIEDFKSERDKISRKEKEKTLLEKEIKELRKRLDNELLIKEDLNKDISELREEFKENRTILIEKNKNIEEKKKAIKSKAGNIEDLEEIHLEICKAIKLINEEYEKSEENKNAIELLYNECNNDMISAKSKLLSLKERSVKDRDKLQSALGEEGIESIDKVKDNFMSREEIDKLKLLVEEYKNIVTKLTGNIENIKKKINNRILSEEQWLEIQNSKNNIQKTLKSLEEDKIRLETEVTTLKESFLKKKKLLVDREELEHKLALLDDLDKLFKGKKFVEFVAANQLKYVSIEACKWLKEITSGNYGLEVDDNGKFIIRDYKNGGAERDASTLSGGETFVTSLALALALSAQIQLKGTAPLELFFLDEGFGTLDDNLLEVVMDSLERIHNDRLSIGIISHVESIKNRVPVKLIVTAAQAGMGGSKVRIERS